MPKFFVANQQIQDETIYITGEDVNHIVNVLRLHKQDKIFVCNKDSEITYEAEIKDITKEQVVCDIIEEVTKKAESEVQVTIFQGLPKADKMEYIIQKTTELGVKEIVPVLTKRCIVKLEGKDEAKKIERWQKIAEVAAKQSGRDMIPKVKNVMKLENLKDVISEFDLFLVAYEEEKQLKLKEVLSNKHIELLCQSIKENKKMNLEDRARLAPICLKIGIVIGPEGGFENNEVEELKQNGARIVTLGSRILRTETASLAILSNIMYEFNG